MVYFYLEHWERLYWRSLQSTIWIITPGQPLQQCSTMKHYYLFASFQQKKAVIAVEYGDREHSSKQSCLKIDAVPSFYACVKNFLNPLQTLIIPSKLPPAPFSTNPQSNCRNRILDEVKWLKTANATNVWTSMGSAPFPEESSYKKTWNLINSPLNSCVWAHPRHIRHTKVNTIVECWSNLCWWKWLAGI